MPSSDRFERKPCLYTGCTEPGGKISGYCRTHVNVALPCMIDGCMNRVAAHSRSRCCGDHRVEGVRLLRKAFKPWDQ